MTVAARRVASAWFCTIVVASCGGSSDTVAPTANSSSSTPSMPAPPPTPPASSAADRSAGLRLYEAIALHVSLAASPLYYGVRDNETPWTTSGPCVFGSGSLQSTLDGGPVTPGVPLPSGSHGYSVIFTNCLVDGLSGITLTGISHVGYVTSDWENVTASVRFGSMRGTGLAFYSDLDDVTGEGSGTWMRTNAAGSTTVSYAPDRGSRLVNNMTTGVALFQSGKYSQIFLAPPPGSAAAGRWVYDSLALTINDIPYVLEGSISAVFGFESKASYAGEVRITSQGALVGRLYFDVSGNLQVEALSPLVPL